MNNMHAGLEEIDSSSHMSSSMPDKIGKYEIINELGRGTCGIVYRGFDPFVQREVAVKVGQTEMPTETGQNVEIQRDFFAEAHAAGKLQHPHIVSLYDAGIEGDYNYLVMEYVEGVTLLEFCRAGGARLSTEKIIECMFKCCRALEYSHRMGVIHRDIKPSNIMLSTEGETKLMDFSIAEVTQNLFVTPEEVIGSPSYMAPEQILKKAVVPQSDLYSLGAVMYQLLTGERPFSSVDIQQVFRDIVHKEAPLLKDKRKDLPERLSKIVQKALSKDPADRYQSGQEFGNELTTVYDELRYAERKILEHENMDALKKLGFFKSITDEDIEEIYAASSMLTFKPGAVVIEEDDIDDSFYIIVRGQVEVRKSGRLVTTLEQGDCFGEIGFLASHKRTATIVAYTDLLVFKVNAMLIETVSKDCQLRFYKAFNEALIQRLAFTNIRLSQLSNYN